MREHAIGPIPVLLVGAVALAGCTADEQRAEPVRAFEAVTCPTDIEVDLVLEHECGVVVVHAAGGDQKVMVTRIEPPSKTSDVPILSTGGNLGQGPGDYGGIAPKAQRTGRRLYIVDLPGTGHSEPTLHCPEVEDGGLTDSAGDAEAVSVAIASCREQLDKAGVNPEDYSVPQLADSLYQVMSTIGEPLWQLSSDGTTGAVALEVARQHPEAIESMVLDSYVVDDRDPTATMDAVVRSIARDCRADSSCRQRYGDVEARWRKAQRAIAAEPLTVGTTTIDSNALLRAARHVVTSVGPERLPQLVEDVLSRGVGEVLPEYTLSVQGSSPLCVGYQPGCDNDSDVSLGAVLSALCPTAADLPDWRKPCAVWGVDASPSKETPAADVPALVFSGKFDAYALPSQVRTRVRAELPDAFVVESSTLGHGVVWSDCMAPIRNEWLAGDPHDPPPQPDCLGASLDFS